MDLSNTTEFYHHNQLSTITNNTTTNCLNDTGQNIGLDIFKGILMTLVIIATIVGNLLVISAILKFRTLRTMNNYFIFSLAIADLFVGLLVQTSNMYNEMGGKLQFGTVVCDLYNSTDVFLTTVSLLHLCCISCDRYLAILHPFRYKHYMKRRVVIIMIVCSWVLSSLMSYAPICSGIYAIPEPREVNETREVNDNHCEFEVRREYAFISSSISFWIPCTIMVCLYRQIFVTARRQEQEIKKQQVSYLYNNNLEKDETTPSTIKKGIRFQLKKTYNEVKKMRREHRAAKTLGIIMGMFVLCMGPIFLWYTITFGICPETCKLPPCRKWVITLVFWTGYINSCMNPIIYAFFNRDFKLAFKRLFFYKRLQSRGLNDSSISSEVEDHQTVESEAMISANTPESQ